MLTMTPTEELPTTGPSPPPPPRRFLRHVSAVLRKLQLSNRHELSRWAVERRLID